jgi:hypothetical protein
VRRLAVGLRADPAERGAAEHGDALHERLRAEVLGIEPERGAGGGVGVAQLGLTAGGAGLRALRVGEQAHLGRGRGRRGRRALRGVVLGGHQILRSAALGAGVGLGLARLRRRERLGDGLQMRVRVRVAVHVLQHDIAAEALGAAHLDDLAVVDGDHRGTGLGEDVDALAARLGLDRDRRVAALALAVGLGQRAGVGALGAHREAALGQAGERADEIARDAADHLRPHQDAVDVPIGVVVSEDRPPEVLVAARCLEVASRREDRVNRVERVLHAILVGVHAVLLPGRGHELHPAQRAGGGDVQVAAVVGLDLVDPGQDLPTDAVLHAGGLVDREQEGRDAELVDEEVRHADLRRARDRERVARVARGGAAVGVRQLRRLDRLDLGLDAP